MKKYVYDLETLLGMFSAVFKDKETGELHIFVIHKSRNDSVKLKQFIPQIGTLIGFNNVNFDSQVFQYIQNNIDEWIEQSLDGEEIAGRIYEIAQLVIQSEFPIYKKWEIQIPQIDLFLILHLNNKARRCSLKDIQIAMGWWNVQDMPIHHNSLVSNEQVNEILEYNINDVESTNELDNRCQDLQELRLKIGEKYGLDCMNYNNGKIGEELLLKLYCEKTHQNPRIVRYLRTERQFIRLKECIPDYIQFNLKPFKDVLSYFNNKVVYGTKGAFTYEFDHLECVYTYGTGGIHANTKSGIYESDENYVIKTFDVASLYPSLAVTRRLFPAHLGEEFYNIYEKEIVGVRLAEKAKPKEQQDKVLIDGYKEAANIPYGKSGSEFSFLYDTKYTLDTTISGQLAISMLIDMLLVSIPEIKVIMVNTDGAEVKIHRKYEDIYNRICKIWMEDTGLILEFDEYQKIVLDHVNSYLAIYTNGKVKQKGRFVVDSELWKDNSQRIVAIALKEYYVNGKSIEDTVNNHKDILDFCKRSKMTKGNVLTERFIIDGDYQERELSKTNRYYVSNKGSSLIKVLPPLDKKKEDKLMVNVSQGYFDFVDDMEKVEPPNRETNLESGYLCTIYNKHNNTRDINDYDICKDYYVHECKKIIKVIENA